MQVPMLASAGLCQQPRGPESAIRNLALGILLQAFRDLIAEGKPEAWQMWQEDALEWCFSEEGSPGSFHWVCAILGFSAGKILKWLRTVTGPDDCKPPRELLRKLSRFQMRH